MNPNALDLFTLENDDNSTSPFPVTNVSGTTPSTDEVTAAVAAMAHTRLPALWRNAVNEWFVHAEAVFANQRIRADTSRVNIVVSALDQEGVRAILDLVGPNASYNDVKHRLITTFSVPQAMRFRSIVQPGGMGDRRPSQLLRDMRAVLPDGIGDAALKEFWLQKLPQTILTVVSGMDGSLQELAERADRVMDASVGRHDISAVAVPNANDSRLHAIESAILALTKQMATLATSQSQDRVSRSGQDSRSRATSRSRSRSRPHNDAWCFYHNRFGAKAHSCRTPCSYKSSEN